MKIERSNKFDLFYYGQVNLLGTVKIKCSFEIHK